MLGRGGEQGGGYLELVAENVLPGGKFAVETKDLLLFLREGLHQLALTHHRMNRTAECGGAE